MKYDMSKPVRTKQWTPSFVTEYHRTVGAARKWARSSIAEGGGQVYLEFYNGCTWDHYDTVGS